MSSGALPESGWRLGPGDPGWVSYIMPAHNVAGLIEETLESCRAQCHRPLEVVVVDDGSTDATAAVVEAYRERHAAPDFVVRLLRQRNSGPCVARNSGLKASRGKILGFLDSDDLIPTYRTRFLREALEGHGAEVAYGTSVRFRDLPPPDAAAGGSDREGAPVGWEEASTRPEAKFVPALWTFLMTRELAERVGPISEEFVYNEDFEYITRLRMACSRMLKSQVVVHHYRIRAGSITATARPANARDRLRAATTIVETLSTRGRLDAENQRILANVFLICGIECVRHGLPGEARQSLGMGAQLERRKVLASLLHLSGLVLGTSVGCHVGRAVIRGRAAARGILAASSGGHGRPVPPASSLPLGMPPT